MAAIVSPTGLRSVCWPPYAADRNHGGNDLEAVLGFPVALGSNLHVDLLVAVGRRDTWISVGWTNFQTSAGLVIRASISSSPTASQIWR
jgi:hypothetical protein